MLFAAECYLFISCGMFSCRRLGAGTVWSTQRAFQARKEESATAETPPVSRVHVHAAGGRLLSYSGAALVPPWRAGRNQRLLEAEDARTSPALQGWAAQNISSSVSLGQCRLSPALEGWAVQNTSSALASVSAW